MKTRRIQKRSPRFLPMLLAGALLLSACADDDDGRAPIPTATASVPPVSTFLPTPVSSATSPPTATILPSATAAPTPSPTTDECPAVQLPPGVELGEAELRLTDDCRGFVRTPDSFFDDLDAFPYEPHYVTVDGMRMHYIDEGPRDGEVVLMLHGQPSWAYLYRKMIPIIAEAGFRAIAVDHIGMGRSDKPVELDDYSYLQHVAWIEEFLDAADLHDVTLFCQDWGSLIGLRVVGDMPDRFARVVIANGRLPVIPASFDMRSLFTVPDPPLLNPDVPFPFTQPCDEEFNVCFSRWIAYALTNPNFRPSQVLDVATAIDVTETELDAYDAPFPDLVYMSGVRTFPSLIVTVNEEPTNEAARVVFDNWDKPLLTLFGRLDRNLGSHETQAEMSETVPGALGQPHHAYPDAAHFIQEEKGEDLATRVVAFMEANPLPPPVPTDVEALVNVIVANGPSYGEVNPSQLRRMLTVAPEDDGPFYMFNLIRFRENAEYADGSDADLTGEEADARYGELVRPILESFGAGPVFVSKVEEHLIGEEDWHQVAIARYPSRAAFFEMVMSPEFQAASVHKEAGVERSTVIVTQDVTPDFPFDPESAPFPPSEDDPIRAVVHLIRYNTFAVYADGRETTLTGREAMALYEESTGGLAVPLGIRPGLWLDVEGVFVGDGRRWEEARVNLFPSLQTFDQLNAQPQRPEDFANRAAAIFDTYALMTLPLIGPER